MILGALPSIIKILTKWLVLLFLHWAISLMVAAENVVANIAEEFSENNECVLNWKCTDVHLIFSISFSASGKRFLYSYVLLNFWTAIEILHCLFGDFFPWAWIGRKYTDFSLCNIFLTILSQVLCLAHAFSLILLLCLSLKIFNFCDLFFFSCHKTA